MYFDENIEKEDIYVMMNTEELLNASEQMYYEIAKEFGDVFKMIKEKKLIDTKQNKGKSMGCYAIYIPNEKLPYIFANFNNTLEDMETVTHEFGHAYQFYKSRNIQMQEINMPSLDNCEIHAMAMELMTLNTVESILKEDSVKYKFKYLSNMINLLPYVNVVDEFQHIVYENYTLTKKERREIWRTLEKKYTPNRNYGDNKFLESGAWWFKQGHIFKNPFYYIDYSLAIISSIEFLNKFKEDKEECIKNYNNLCELGGAKSFMDMIDYANLSSPFEEFTIKKSFEVIVNELENILSI